MGSIGTAYPPKVVDYVGRVQKSPGAALGAKNFFSENCPFFRRIFFVFSTLPHGKNFYDINDSSLPKIE